MVLYKFFLSSAKSSDCVLVNLNVKRTIGKNWPRPAMTISGTLEYNWAGVHKCLEIDPAKNN
jgi:predicted secreted Zn-dependent protease